MYLYFDNAGTLKEIFTADPTRQGASDWNKIHSYWESTSGTITGCLIRYARPDVNPFDENAVSIEVAYNTKGNAELPYDSKKDVKFFEYFKNYYFYNFVIPDTVLGVEGPVIATIYYIVSIDGVSTTIPMGMFTFQVEPNATQKVKYDDYISISQWNYLVERLSNLEDGFIQGDHTLDGDITYNGDVVFSNTASATFYCPTTFEGISVSITNVDFTFADSNSTIAGGPLTIYGSIYFDEDYYVKFGNLLDIDGENGTILPITNNTTELGSSSKRFKKIYAADIDANSITVNNSVKSSLNPSLNNYFNLGASNKKWARLYCVELNVDGVNTNLVPTGATQTLGVKNGYWWAGVYADDAVFTDVDIQGTLKTNSGTGMRIEGGLLPKTSGAYNVGSSTLQWNSVYSVAGIFSASLNANGGELTVSSNNTVIKHLTVQNSLTVPITPTFSNGAYISGSITDGTYSWSVADVAGVLALFGDDADSVVNKINEVLDIFENYPEGDDLVSVLATKFDKSSIITSYSDVNVSNTTVYSALCTKTAIDTLNSYFGSGGIVYKAFADENGTNLYTYYMKYSDLDVSGGVVVAINNIPVASEVNVSGQPIPVSSTDDMTDTTKMYWLTTNGYIYYYDGNDWVQTTQKLFDPSSSLIPAINHDISLGSDSKRWLSGYFNELYVGSEGNNIFSIDDEGNIVFNNQPTFNNGVNIPSGEVLTDGTYSISVEEIVNNKVNVDANVPTLTSGMADNLTPYNENSGDNQTEPFIFQATGTANGNKPDYSTKSYALLQEKQGNTIVYNQQIYNPNFDSTARWAYQNVTFSVLNNVGIFTATAQYGSIQAIGVKFVKNHKYLIMFEHKGTTGGFSIYTSVDGQTFKPSDFQNTTNSNFKFYSRIVDYTGNGGSLNLIFQDNRASDWTEQQFRNVYIIDITQWFNGDIPQALLDNPSLFPMYYRGSLAYNTGEIVNSNARYLDCIDINQFDEITELGLIQYDKTQSNFGQNISSTSNIRATNYQSVLPNTTYYSCNKGSGSIVIFCYDINKNPIIVGDSGYISATNTTFTTPNNCSYIRFYCNTLYGTTYNHDICINISNNNINGTYYPHKLLTHLDTGTETLLAFDTKVPDGTIYRNTGSADLSTLIWTQGTSGSGATYYETKLTGIKNHNLGTVYNDVICSKYVNAPNNNYPATIMYGTFVVSGEYITVYSETSPTGSVQYLLETPTTEQGTTFSENLVINDYGTMNWNNTSFNGVPQGNLIFYPVDYKAFIDTLYNYSSGTPSNIALKSDLTEYVKQVDITNKITLATGLTATFLKCYKTGNIITLTFNARNTSGSSISSGTSIATISSDICPNTVVFRADVGGTDSRAVISHISQSLTLGSNFANDTVVYVSISYVIA